MLKHDILNTIAVSGFEKGGERFSYVFGWADSTRPHSVLSESKDRNDQLEGIQLHYSALLLS